jgi:hypothetical protein
MPTTFSFFGVVFMSLLVSAVSTQDQCLILRNFWANSSAEQLWVHECAEGWKEGGTDCCGYYGVTCDSKSIVELNLNGCGIKGGSFGE